MATDQSIEAATREMQRGTNFTVPSSRSGGCRGMLSVLPGGDMAKFGKNGSDTTSAAVRLARAYTGR